MRIAIVSSNTELSKKVSNELLRLLYVREHIIDNETPEMIITVGGDGTVLEAYHRYQHMINDVIFVGVHTGSLGFYADFMISELDELVECLDEMPKKTVTFPLLEVKLCFNEKCINLEVLNEFTIVNALRTLKADVYIDNELFEHFYGTGLCISTPSGSTGYNKSLGGAVLHPKIDAFQVTEMAGINNSTYRSLGSSLILNKNQVVTLKSDQFKELTITLDHMHHKYDNVNIIECRLSENRIKFARYKKLPFYTRVRRSFIGDFK